MMARIRNLTSVAMVATFALASSALAAGMEYGGAGAQTGGGGAAFHGGGEAFHGGGGAWHGHEGFAERDHREFRDHDRGGAFLDFGFGPGWWGPSWGYPYDYAPYSYAYGYPYSNPYGYPYSYGYSYPYYQAAPPATGATAAGQPQFRYRCDNPAGYYPQVSSCGGPWHEEAATSSTGTVTPDYHVK